MMELGVGEDSGVGGRQFLQASHGNVLEALNRLLSWHDGSLLYVAYGYASVRLLPTYKLFTSE